MSCHCDQCFLGDNPNFDHGWKVQSLNNRTNNLKINTGEDDKLAEEADKVMEQPPTTNERKIDLIEVEYVVFFTNRRFRRSSGDFHGEKKATFPVASKRRHPLDTGYRCYL